MTTAAPRGLLSRFLDSCSLFLIATSGQPQSRVPYAQVPSNDSYFCWLFLLSSPLVPGPCTYGLRCKSLPQCLPGPFLKDNELFLCKNTTFLQEWGPTRVQLQTSRSNSIKWSPWSLVLDIFAQVFSDLGPVLLYYSTNLASPNFIFFFLNVFIYLFITYFLAALGLRCCVLAFSSCGEWGLLFVAVCRPPTAVASLVAEHRL